VDALLPATEVLPAAQSWQAAPPAPYFPMPQLTQSACFTPLPTATDLPAAQEVQPAVLSALATVASDHLPATQLEHEL
jgi:hypothetical protein